jgi:hypothetical protein
MPDGSGPSVSPGSDQARRPQAANEGRLFGVALAEVGQARLHPPPRADRELAEMLAERGVKVDHTTLYRWSPWS